MPLHFAFGCFYLSDLMENKHQTSEPSFSGESGFSFEIYCGAPSYNDLGLFNVFPAVGFGLILLSVFLPSLLLYRKYQTEPPKLFD